MWRWAWRATAVVGAAGVGYVAITRPEELGATVDGLARFTRSAYVGAVIALDYKWNVSPIVKEFGDGSAEHKAIRKVVDKRCAERLLRLCQHHGGVYVKFAQVISTNNISLPPEWTVTMSAAQDRARTVPWHEISTVFEQDTGRPAQEVFEWIEEQPIAAASLAQVHRACTREGEEVAVKIQYPHLQRQMKSDMAAIRVLADALGWLFPDFAYSWLLPDFEASLRNEVNFLQEAHNAERVAAMFADDPHVYVPRILRQHTTRRVVVMEFIHGVKLTDKVGLQALGIPSSALAATLARTFADMAHVHGFLHADPHAGNLLVRRSPGATSGHQFQLVVLDHGMYRRLTPQFRAAYCRLWKAMVLRDHDLGRKATIELGLEPEHYDAMSLMLTYRPASSSTRLGGTMSKEDVQALKAKYADVKAVDINRFMQRLPRDLLFVLRSTNMIRSLNLELGGTARQRFRIMGESAIRGLVLTEAMGDFSHVAAAHVKQAESHRPTTAAALVSDVALPAAWEEGAATSQPATVAHTPTSILDHLRTLARTVLPTRTSPPMEPLTYVNALSTGAVITQPTESEMQRARRGGSVPLSRQIEVTWEIAKLRAVLWWLDAVLWWATWVGLLGVNGDGAGPSDASAGGQEVDAGGGQRSSGSQGPNKPRQHAHPHYHQGDPG